MSKSQHPIKLSPILIEAKSFIDVNPILRRITFYSEQLKCYPLDCSSAMVKVFLPQTGQKYPALPILGEKGPIWPKNEPKPIVRTYTIRNIRPELGEIDIEFILHDDNHAGPASLFAKNVKPGNIVGITAPRVTIIPKVKNYYFIGDSSAFPAIAAIVETISSEAHVELFLHIYQVQDKIDFISNAGLNINWFMNENELIQHVISSEINEQFAYFWIAGEEHIVVSLRRYLRHEKSCSHQQFYAIPYWRKGKNEDQYNNARHQIMDN